uniref:Uncharacterized protein n=1 Tax=Setaria italica TaxID=4555 RepID=K3Y0H0_SETIT
MPNCHQLALPATCSTECASEDAAASLLSAMTMTEKGKKDDLGLAFDMKFNPSFSSLVCSFLAGWKRRRIQGLDIFFHLLCH